MKKLLVSIIVIILIGGLSFLLYNRLNDKSTIDEDFDNNKNNIIHLANISLNGLKIGDEFKSDKKYLFKSDKDFSYKYNNIYMNLKDNHIDSLGFFTDKSDKKNSVEIDDIDIEYKKKKLQNVDDFKKAFGQGKESRKDESEYKLVFTDDDIELRMIIINDKIDNLTLKKIDQ